MSNQPYQIKEPGKVTGVVFNIQRYSIHDGPGIRTTVFLKGCPLRCHWCSNPESVNPFPELGFIRKYCTKCLKCVEVCPAEAITIGEDGYPIIDRNLCDNCGLCTEVCSPGALKVYGQKMTASHVLEEVMKDSSFYRESGGGVTLSGGEPLHQPAFAISLLRLCQASGVHTAMETCGFTSLKIFKAALEYTDYLLFDVKHIDSEIHRRYTGQSNKLILENLKLAARSGVHILVRMPLIPGINDTEDNIKAMAELIKGLGDKIEGVELMPYHRLGASKCEALGRIYPMGGLPAADINHVEQVRTLVETIGVHCSISR